MRGNRFKIIKKSGWQLFSFLFILTLPVCCTNSIPDFQEINKKASIFPDYDSITVPCNIAPLNFRINEPAQKYVAVYEVKGKELFRIASSNGKIMVPFGKWKKLIEASKGQTYSVRLFAKINGHWGRYKPITNYVAADSIDSYLVYRLIEPGFETWNKMGIYQRCLTNFDELPIMENSVSEGNCMNCHSFSLNNGDCMLFHMRAGKAGTYFYTNGNLEKVDTKTDSTLSPCVYPSWHPGGKLVAFSVNRIVQTFHAVPGKKIEVLDTLSDIVIYNLQTHSLSTSPLISSKSRLETFPTWSPDGKYLYFCSAKARPPTDYKNIRYDLVRIAYDPESNKFGEADTVYSAASAGKSVSFPRVSPDGKRVMFCLSDYGNFSIWHPESDLYLFNLETKELSKPNINSSQTESYHTWSSTGRWLVFSSRRIDGHYTRPYFSYVDRSGNLHKPFILPQKDPEFYDRLLKSYNVPELVIQKVKLTPREIVEKMDSEPVKAKFVSK